MIPKIIHYCWFGRGKMPELALRCIDSWRLYLPDYKLVLWNEDNFDINSNKYVKEAYVARKFAFVTDYVRLYAMCEYGGIYMDTDVEVLKSLDSFLFHKAFSGFEDVDSIPTGIMASEKGGTWVKMQLEHYKDKCFVLPDGTYDMTTNVATITSLMVDNGFILDNTLQDFRGIITIYPKDYFCPKSYKTGEIIKTDRTHTIHHFAGSWLPKKTKLTLKVMNILGPKMVDIIKKILNKVR